MHKHRYFISFEGIEGVGKSTMIQFVCQQLDAMAITYQLTREPGGTCIGEQIRTICLSNQYHDMLPETELLLMFAGRAQHIGEVILPALRAGKWVLSDRFVDASFAYQGGGRAIALDKIRALADWLQSDLWPDCTILLDAPVDIVLARLHDRSEGVKDRIENEDIAFFERVRQVYLTLAKQNHARFQVVDATQPIDDVKKAIWAIIQALM